MAKSVMAVTLAGVITAACVAVGSNSVNNGTDVSALNTQAVTDTSVTAADDTTSQMTGGDAKGAFTTEDLGISASDYTDDEQIAKAADTIANADAQNIVNTQFELIPVEKLAIAADTSSENEVMGGRKEYIMEELSSLRQLSLQRRLCTCMVLMYLSGRAILTGQQPKHQESHLQ